MIAIPGLCSAPDYEPSPKDFEPTMALPGTLEKVQVLAGRVRSGKPLWHPADATIDVLEGQLAPSKRRRAFA